MHNAGYVLPSRDAQQPLYPGMLLGMHPGGVWGPMGLTSGIHTPAPTQSEKMGVYYPSHQDKLMWSHGMAQPLGLEEKKKKKALIRQNIPGAQRSSPWSQPAPDTGFCLECSGCEPSRPAELTLSCTSCGHRKRYNPLNVSIYNIKE